MNNDNEIYPQITPRKKVSLAKPPAERSQLVSGTFGSVAGGRSGRRISLEKKPGDGIYINPNPVREINFPASPMPAVNAAQIPAARNNIATAVGATPSDPELIAAREGSNIQIRRGHFRCAYDLEFVWLLATAIPALALLGVFAFSVTGDITRLFDNIYNAICIGGIVLSCAFSAICYGKNYGFIAEQDAFVISRRGKTRRYYYADITDVRFEEFSLFGKKRGCYNRNTIYFGYIPLYFRAKPHFYRRHQYPVLLSDAKRTAYQRSTKQYSRPRQIYEKEL